MESKSESWMPDNSLALIDLDAGPPPSLHLLDLPSDLLLEALHDAPCTVRETCRRFRDLLGSNRQALTLRPWDDLESGAGGRRVLPYLFALLQHLPSLRALHIDRFEFPSLACLAACPSLTSLTIHDSSRIGNAALPAVATCRHLLSLDLSGCELLSDIYPLSALAALRSLDIGCCHMVTSIAPLENCPYLTSLVLGNRVASLAPLTALTALASLTCDHCVATDFTPLATCGAALTHLVLLGTFLPSLSLLAGCTCMSTLALDTAPLLAYVAHLAHFGAALTTLELRRCPVHDLSPLALCPSLTALYLEELTAVGDLSPLACCTALATLQLSKCRSLTSVAPLAPLAPSLTHLDLHRSSAILDVQPFLASCTALTYLDLRSTHATSVVALAACGRLRTLRVADNYIPREQLHVLGMQRPRLRVDWAYN